ncbi:MAG: CDP-alcohol phosphatidyltransferase family protein [Ktedonobacteraceae bacterium]|nr:CDP-alcohol phosphatidyltransferase family protein [Ktedonobacteraceae bacterium]
MQKLKQKFGSIYSEDEARFLVPWQKIRQQVLSPIARLLAYLGISADLLSYLSVALSIAFCVLAPVNFTIAFWLLIASIICDGLDGVEARLKGVATARGSFTDAFCDQMAVAFIMAGMVWRGSVHPVLAILFVYVYTALVTLLIFHTMLHVSSRWIVRPSRMLFYAAIALLFFFHVNVLNYLLLVYLLALPLLIVSFWRLRKVF